MSNHFLAPVLGILFSGVILAVPVGLGTEASASDTKIDAVKVTLKPKANTTFLHTSTAKSKNSIKRPTDREDHILADVMTNIIEIKTGAGQFDSALPFEVSLKESLAQAMTRTMQPIPRQSPLAGMVGTTGKFNLYPDGSMKVADVRNPGKLNAAMIKTMLAMAQTVLFPIELPKTPLKVGTEFETSDNRSFPVDGERVSIQMLKKYTVSKIELSTIELTSEIVMRPQRPSQAQKVYGVGTGKAIIDRNLGIVSDTWEQVTLEAKLLGPKGWILFKSETETETTTTARD